MLFAFVFPHQLYASHPALKGPVKRVFLIEDSLFFGDGHHEANLHQQKIWLHSASLDHFEQKLSDDYEVKRFRYIDPENRPTPLEQAVAECPTGSQVQIVEPDDFLLRKRLFRLAEKRKLKLVILDNPGFINTPSENQQFREKHKRWFMADFYKWQRQRLDVLMDESGKPAGGSWSYDADNRKKVPKRLLSSLPAAPQATHHEIDHAAAVQVAKQFSDRPGNCSKLIYPTTHLAALDWLRSFLENRFALFGDYEDAIVPQENWLWHSVLTPSLNIGLLTPTQVLEETLQLLKTQEVPLNSAEGFIRQIIGWREFVRATYAELGVEMRRGNHWEHHRSMPAAFYKGTTGLAPFDDAVSRVLETGYCHHIERLMVLGGLMFLCEISPHAIYRWFMELFVDSYDWVMVPNVYGMSQHADGGLITTKPYFSGSSYIRKMSHHAKGPWCEVWDGLYWRWIAKHREKLASNPRWSMMCAMAKKMPATKLAEHQRNAEQFLEQLN